MNKQEYIDWITGIYQNNARIRKLNITYIRPDDWPRFHKGVCSTVHVFSRRNSVMDQICEGEEILCPTVTEAEFSKKNIEDFLFNSNDVFDVTLFFHSCERTKHQDGLGFLAVEHRK